jgi:hypothetical protein
MRFCLPVFLWRLCGVVRLRRQVFWLSDQKHDLLAGHSSAHVVTKLISCGSLLQVDEHEIVKTGTPPATSFGYVSSAINFYAKLPHSFRAQIALGPRSVEQKDPLLLYRNWDRCAGQRQYGRTHADTFEERVTDMLELGCCFGCVNRFRFRARRAIFALRSRLNLALSPLIADMHCSLPTRIIEFSIAKAQCGRRIFEVKS